MATTADPELPAYREITEGATATIAGTSAPRATTSPYKTEFKTSLQDEKGYNWLLLRVKSRSTSSTSSPFFVECDTVSGLVELDATKTDSVKAVVVEVQAGTTAVGQEEERFLSLKETLWTNNIASGVKLKGKHSWPFEFVLPREVEVVGPHEKKGFFQLPPSFSERASPAYLDYRLVVTIKRGMLKVNQKLTTTFFYQPLTIPEGSPTPLRKLAYAEGRPLPSPKEDPEGWNVLPKFGVEGVLFGSKDVKVQCQLAVANPLQYALGSPVPLHLVLESEDAQALDVLSNPAAIRIELVRAMTTGSEATAKNPDRRTNNFFTVGMTRAYFWRVDEPSGGENRRSLHGEIDLEMKLKPTFVFPRLSIEYTVDFVGFEAAGWVLKSHSHSKDKPLLSRSVRVTSRQLAGINMRSNAPPGYQKPEIDYNKSLGYLENGNQRFLHHAGR